MRNLEARRQNRPSSFLTDVGEGIIEALPTAAAAIEGGLLTGGGALSTAAVGGGLSAAGADWSDPRRAAVQTALGAAAPVVGGKVGQAVGSRVASRLASPVAQTISRAGGELLGGGLGNAGASAAEQLAFEGRIDPREAAKQFVVGGALSAPGAFGAARRPTLSPRTPEGAIIAPESPLGNPRLLPPAIFTAPESPLANRRLLSAGNPNEVPTEQLVSPTRPIPIPNAQTTQRMPAITPEMIAAENAPTTPAALPRFVGNEPVRQTRELQSIGNEEPTQRQRRTAEIPRVATQEPVSKVTQEEAPPRRPTERLPVPPATDQNIGDLRARQEQLGRLAYDRRGDFTGDLRDEYNQLTAHIRDYENARALQEIGPPPGQQPERNLYPPPQERAARREALQAKEPEMPETLTPGRKVTQEVQIPRLKASETHASREDARQGHFEQFSDEELVDEIRRMEGIRNNDIRGRSKLTPEQLEANRFDLKVAVEQQKERRRLQQQIGIEPGERIAPRTPARPEGRRIQHTTFGEVTEAPDQAGVPKGKLRVVEADGSQHTIQNPRTRGNRQASFSAIPAAAMPEMAGKTEPPLKAKGSESYAIPEEAMPELAGRKSKGHVMGFGLGFLGGKGKLPSRSEVAETAGGVQTIAQLGNPKFVIRNVLQHIAFGKQERTATRLAAAVDWAYSKATGKGRQIAAPRGSDLAAYVRNWQKAVKAHKSGQPLPGGNTPLQHTANANKIDKAVNTLMTYMNEIPDSAQWQTRFEDSLQSIVNASKRSRSQINMSDAIDQAKLEADRASLRDSNFASAGLQKLKEGLNKLSSPIFGTDNFGAGDFIVKYAKTPGALFKRGLERSPLGLFQVAKEAATPGPYRRRNTLLALSRVAEGAATGVGLGAGLAAAGVLVGPEEEGKTGKSFEREEGVRGYSINTSALTRMLAGDFSGKLQEGDTLYSIDWLQPWAMNLSAGAALWNLHKDGKLGAKSGGKATGEAVYNSLAKTLDIMGDQSILKNLSQYLDKASGDNFSDKFLNFTKAVGLDVPSSFVPSLARQTRQVIDPYERDTRPEKRGGFEGFAAEAFGRAAGQIPSVSSSFPTRPSLLTGEDRKTALEGFGTGARIASQFSPANVSSYTPQPVAEEISRLNNAGQKVAISFPAPKTDRRTGEREPTSELRGRERRFAETFSRMSQDLVKDSFYKDADDETKAAAWAGLKRHLSNLGKEDFEEKSVEEIVESAMSTVEKRRDKEER